MQKKIECESSSWWLGVAGVFNETTYKCLCPEGYSGKDDWGSFDSCHVNENFNRQFKMILIWFCVAEIILTTFSLNYVQRKWNFTRVILPKRSSRYQKAKSPRRSTLTHYIGEETSNNPKKKSLSSRTAIEKGKRLTVTSLETGSVIDDEEEVKNESEDVIFGCIKFSSFQLFKKPEIYGASNIAQQTFEREWRRKKSAIFAIYIFWSYGITICFVLVVEVLKDPWYKYDNKLYRSFCINLGLVVGSTLLMTGFYYLIVSLYTTLPSVRQYGNLLNMSSILSNYPYLVFRLANFSIWTTIIVSGLLLVFFPMFAPEYRRIFDTAFLAIMMFFILLFCITFTILLINIRKIFQEMIATLTERGGEIQTRLNLPTEDRESEIKEFKTGLCFSTLFLLFGWVAGCFGTAVFLFMILYEQRYAYVTIQVLGYITIGFASFVTVLLTFTDGGLSPMKSR